MTAAPRPAQRALKPGIGKLDRVMGGARTARGTIIVPGLVDPACDATNPRRAVAQ